MVAASLAPPAPPPAPPLPPLNWAAPPPAAPVSPPAALVQHGELALGRPAPPPAAPPPAAAPPAAAQPGFALLDAVGAVPLPPPVARPTPTTTLSMLRNGAGPGQPGEAAAEILPASRVTVPLAEVMRLISAGGQPPASPFDAVRASLHSAPALR